MAIIRNTASMNLKGRVGNTTYYMEGGRQLARVSMNSSNYGESAARSQRQQYQRGKWGNLVNFYKVSKAWMKKAYENKKANQSDYNRFMQLNTAVARVYLTKAMYAQGGCVVDGFRISEGSLRSIQVLPDGGVFKTDIALGNLDIGPATTVAQFSSALIGNNNNLHNNMQISFVSYQQEVNQFGVPQLICTAYEVTLDTENTLPLRSFLPVFCSSNKDGFLATNDNISVGAFAYVLSESIGGKTLVSTQQLILNNSTLIAQYTSAEAIVESIKSYGVDADVFLASGSEPTGATPQPFYVVEINNRYDDPKAVGTFVGQFGDYFAGGDVTISLSSAPTSVNTIEVVTDKGHESFSGSTYLGLEGNNAILKYEAMSAMGSTATGNLLSLTLHTDKGELVAEFLGRVVVE